MLKTRTQVSTTQLSEWKEVMTRQQAVMSAQRMKIAEQTKELVRLQSENSELLEMTTTPTITDETTNDVPLVLEASDAPRKSLDDVVGQVELIDRLRLRINGTLLRGGRMGHILLAGPPGYGKTSTSQIIASEISWPLVQTNGPLLKNPDKLISIVGAIHEDSCLMIDEIHAIPRDVEETLYQLMEYNELSVVTKGANAQAITLRPPALPNILIIGCTTMPGLMSEPFRDRFSAQFFMSHYSTEEITTIVSRYWDSVNVVHTPDAARIIALRSKNVPRLAKGLADNAADYLAVLSVTDDDASKMTEDVAVAAMERFGIIEGGLNAQDLDILRALCNNMAPMGLEQLSQLVSMDQKTLVNAHEPSLVRAGLVARTPSGRVATTDAYELLDSLR